MEQEKFIDGYGRSYTVDVDGNIYSYKSGKYLTNRLGKRGKGYLYVSLWSDNVEKKFYVHRLVAQAFVDNPNKMPIVNHKDGNTLNNHFSNLEWVSHQENCDHAWDTKLVNNYGESCGTAKLTNNQADELIKEYLTGLYTQSTLAKKYGINQSQVSRIVNKVRRANQSKGVKS